MRSSSEGESGFDAPVPRGLGVEGPEEKGQEETPGIRVLGLILILFALSIGFCLGLGLYRYAYDRGLTYGLSVGRYHYSSTNPRDLNPRELGNAFLTASMVPLDILVHVVPQDQIPKICHDKDAYACTSEIGDVCQVWFPTELIKFSPYFGTAEWVDHYDNGVIPHEFLHCIYPNWHQPFTDMLAALTKNFLNPAPRGSGAEQSP
jgi:hypothetical protein